MNKKTKVIKSLEKAELLLKELNKKKELDEIKKEIEKRARKLSKEKNISYENALEIVEKDLDFKLKIDLLM